MFILNIFFLLFCKSSSVSQFLKTCLSEPNLISTGQTCIKGFKGNMNRSDKYIVSENRKLEGLYY